MVSFFFNFADLPFEISNFLSLPVEAGIRHFEVLVCLGSLPNFLLNFSSVVLALLENRLVLNESTLQLFHFGVALSSFGKHRCDFLSQSLDSCWTADAPYFFIDPVDLSLKTQDFFLVHYELLPKILRQLCVLIGDFTVSNL
jgi:hypothetical protein